MKYEKRKCPYFQCSGVMRAQKGRRGYYYQCDSCKKSLHLKPKKVNKQDVIKIKSYLIDLRVG
jgi:hypothetical protein